MSTFDESLHPRGQAGNAGQFATKTNDAPAGTLTIEPDEHDVDTLFVSEIGALTYDITDDGDGQYSAYRDGTWVCTFDSIGDPEDHESLDEQFQAELARVAAAQLEAYSLPRPEDHEEVRESGMALAATDDVLAHRATVVARLRAADRMFTDNVPHPGDDIFEAIWTTGEGGHGRQACELEIERYKQMRDRLASGEIRPRDVIGTGLRGDTRKMANRWIDDQQAMYERALVVRGRNLSVNAGNVDYRLRTAAHEASQAAG
ncbi:MAG: hypothetical protein J0J04_07550 [Microbacterium sp.]|uniref:hypothetical protein n=1 Tax=Microbacterium sp. TaxID=51671 RepID=UPI001ACBCB49|nr:hypothetical protein [Microbacterium sp.]MBN9214652.1 hypothetical protein [Microbacterium sp.]